MPRAGLPGSGGIGLKIFFGRRRTHFTERYLDMAARGAFDHAPGEAQGTPTIS
jgi:hypothetical protein